MVSYSFVFDIDLERLPGHGKLQTIEDPVQGHGMRYNHIRADVADGQDIERLSDLIGSGRSRAVDGYLLVVDGPAVNGDFGLAGGQRAEQGEPAGAGRAVSSACSCTERTGAVTMVTSAPLPPVSFFVSATRSSFAVWM